MNNTLDWFEIPVSDIYRAVDFYSTVFDQKIEKTELGGGRYAFIPTAQNDDSNESSTGLHMRGKVSNESGIVLLLNTSDDMQMTLSRIERAGGKIILPKTNVGDKGFIAMFQDTEGNTIGLHSMS